MEDQNNIKLNNISLPPVEDIPRTQDGKIDIESISIGKTAKGNYIVPDEILKAYYKELPDGTTNESNTSWSYNGGLLNKANREVQRMGANALNAKLSQRRSIKEILEDLSRRTVTAEEAEQYGMEEGTTLLEAANLAQIRRAMKGDTKAAEYVRDTLGEKPADKINAEITGLTPEDKEMLQRVQSRLDQI